MGPIPGCAGTQQFPMMTLLQLVRLMLGRFILGAVLGALAVGGYGFWLFSHDQGDFDLRRNQTTTTLAVKRQEIQNAMQDVRKRRDEVSAEIEAEGARAQQADKVIVTLHDLESTWDRFIGNPAQQKANAEQITRMEEMRAMAQAKQAGLKQELTRLIWERDGLELSLGKIDRQLAVAEGHKSIVWHYLSEAWSRMGWGVGVALALYCFGLFVFARRPR